MHMQGTATRGKYRCLNVAPKLNAPFNLAFAVWPYVLQV
jgi:hypothetical protein